MAQATENEQQRCETCGRFGAFPIGDVFLCEACLQERGSCCAAEFDQTEE